MKSKYKINLAWYMCSIIYFKITFDSILPILKSFFYLLLINIY